jgi:acyl carrier protein
MGDRGFINESGNLVVLGRTDGEVKLDGIRFDPLACESSIRSVNGVADAALVMVNHHGRTRACVFVVARLELLSDIREAARSSGAAGDRVQIELCDQLPQLMTGKADRQSLKKQAIGLLDGTIVPSHSIQPRSRAESVIQDVWVNHLKIPLPSVDRTFIELGGSSLQFLTVLIDLKERYGFDFPQDQLPSLDTIERLADAVSVEHDPLKSIDPMVRFHENEAAGTAVLILPGLGGHVWAFRPLAEALGGAYQIAGLDWCKLSSVRGMRDHVLDWLGDRELVVVGFSGGSRTAGKLVQCLEGIGRMPLRLVVLDGVPRDRFAQRVRNFLSCRLRRPPEGGNAVDDYLFKFRMKGVRFYEKLGFSSLKTPIRLLSTNEKETGLFERWQAFGDVTLRRSSAEHLDLVKHPIPQEVIDLIRGESAE